MENSTLNLDKIDSLYRESYRLLKQLIAVESFSRDESRAAAVLRSNLTDMGLTFKTKGLNTWIESNGRDSSLPTILFNSHIDTVRASDKWSYNPFEATEVGDKLYGLGSNDAGASVVSQLAAFRYLNELPNRAYNLIWSATAEEEVSGDGGVALILDDITPIDLAIVGEPTEMQMAVAEKGLMVIDATATGKSGHAAREEGDNAIYKAVEDIAKLKEFKFPKTSDILGDVKISCTIIEAGTLHNVVPDSCKFTLDIRTNEYYSNQEAFAILQDITASNLKERSFRINSSRIDLDHPLVKKGGSLGLTTYGSPTTSDQARIPVTSIKIGPGISSRSHTADEYICKSEIREGINIYIDLLRDLKI